MTKRLLIARHGNTFDPGETVLRVGKRTDLPLSMSGQEQAAKLGAFLKAEGIRPERIYTSNLKRTQQTASIALKAVGSRIRPQPRDLFDELDYGPDEAQPEAAVEARIGKKALAAWDKDAVVPPGWQVDVEGIKDGWMDFVRDVLCDSAETTLVVTSNGVARFAPVITGDFEGFCAEHGLKLSTGAIAGFRWEKHRWKLDYWNRRP